MTLLQNFFFILKRRAFLITWISLVIYIFYKTFFYYQNGQQFRRLRNILGPGLCLSRSTATVLNLCSCLVLLPLCKKLNRLLYRLLSRVWPGLFFFWLERAKSFHMTVAITLVLFAVIHSMSHFVNLWNFSRCFDDSAKDLNLADYKNQNPLHLLLTQPGLTGLSMLLIVMLMGVTSSRVIRRKWYNAFWYTHQLYVTFLVLLVIHPLSGLLKEEVIDSDANQRVISENKDGNNGTAEVPRFVSIQSKLFLPLVVNYLYSNDLQPTVSLAAAAHYAGIFLDLLLRTWQWMALPLICFSVDLVWRMFARNRSTVEILEATHMAGRTVSLKLSCPSKEFLVRSGQYVLLQCSDISRIEWHPFTVVQVPTKGQSNFTVWIRVVGDWTVALEKLLLEKSPRSINMLVDGPFCSALESVSKSDVCMCVAAGVGITPFVALLHNMFSYPRSRFPGRVHLIWIVRNENEVSWLAVLANKTLLELRNSNRPDRLHLEIYITNKPRDSLIKCHDKASIVILKDDVERSKTEDERVTLLTPYIKRSQNTEAKVNYEDSFRVAEKFPLLGCRVRRGRPHWDRVFGYWVHLYPEEKLNLYCCGPKKLVKSLKSKCTSISQTTRTKFMFVHEGFS